MVLPTLLVALAFAQPERSKQPIAPPESATPKLSYFDSLPREEQERRMTEARQLLNTLSIETWKANIAFWTAITVVSVSGLTQGLLFYFGKTRDRNNKIREALASFGAALMEYAHVAGLMELERAKRTDAERHLSELHRGQAGVDPEELAYFTENFDDSTQRLKELETLRTEMQERLSLANASMLVHSLNEYTDETVRHIYQIALRPKDRDEPPLVIQLANVNRVERWLAEMRRHPITFQGMQYWLLQRAGKIRLPELPPVRPVP